MRWLANRSASVAGRNVLALAEAKLRVAKKARRLRNHHPSLNLLRNRAISPPPMTHLALFVRESASPSYAASKCRSFYEAESARADRWPRELRPLSEEALQGIGSASAEDDPGTPLPLSGTISIGPSLQSLM